MCGHPSSTYSALQSKQCSTREKPEVLLAREMCRELGVDVNSQALRMFIRSRWSRISVLAHEIHCD